MYKVINNISVNDDFWVQFKSHLISFGLKGLPRDVHFTIGLDDRSPDLNLHLTRNSALKNKPKVTIVVIKKILFEHILSTLAISLVNNFLQPIDISKLRNKYKNDLGFISFNDLQNTETNKIIEQRLVDSLKDISKHKKKTRLKIKGSIENKLKEFAESEDIQDSLFNNLSELPKKPNKLADYGMIITEDDIMQVARINNEWFTLRPNLTMRDVSGSVLSEQIINQIIYKTKKAIIQVKNAKTYADTKKANKPIRLIKSKNGITLLSGISEP